MACKLRTLFVYKGVCSNTICYILSFSLRTSLKEKRRQLKMACSSSSMSFFKFVMSIYLSLVLILFSLEKGHGLKGEQAAGETNFFHSVDVSTVFSSHTCKPSTYKGPVLKSSLKLVNIHGACYEGKESSKLTLAQILTQDQARVASMQFRHAASLSASKNINRIRDKKTSIPAKSGTSVGTGNYIVTVGLGTPKKDYTLVFDTGSDLTWTQCEPCVKYCYSQNDPVYNPKLSTTYSNISCSSTQCSQLVSGTGNTPGCSGSTCVYGIQYGDQSFSVGFFAKETLTLATDVFPNFLFGCGQNNRGLFGNTDGLLGLGRDAISVVSQTAAKYGKVFSYCLPTKSGSNGYLSFGRGGYSSNVLFTPFSSSQSDNFYFVDIVGITVGGKLLPISASVFQSAGTVVDSGTVITRLPPTAYSALSGAFKAQMKQYKAAPAFSILDTCYDFSGQTTVAIPKISVIFKGNAKVDLGITGILVAVSSSQVCLAFAGNSADSDLGIFGNIQQQTLQVVYDVAGGKLGFGAGGCS